MNERDIKGISTELLCKNEFIKRGYMVSVPICSSCKYDFIADIQGKLIRVQVKYSKKSKIGFTFATKSVHLTTNGAVINKYTSNDVDYLCTYFDGKCYLVSITKVEGRNQITMSFSYDWKNAHHLMMAKDYRIDEQIESILSGNTKEHEYTIQKYTMDNEYITEYSSIDECCNENISHSAHICECINGKRKSAYGYIWKYGERVKQPNMST